MTHPITGLRSRIGPKGQAVIPKPIRDALGIRPGDEVYFSTHEDHMHVEKRSAASLVEAFVEAFPKRRLARKDVAAWRDESYGRDG